MALFPPRDTPTFKLSAHSPGCTPSDTDSAAQPGAGAQCQGTTRVGGRGHPCRSLLRLASPFTSAFPGRWPVGAFPERLSFGEKRSPDSLSSGRRERGAGAGRDRAPRCLPLPGGRHPVPQVRNRGGWGAPPVPRPAPGRPDGWRCDSPPGRAPAKPKTSPSGVPGATRPNLFIHSAPACRQLLLLRRRPGAPSPQSGRVSAWPLRLRPSFVSRYPKRWRIVRFPTWGTRAPPA